MRDFLTDLVRRTLSPESMVQPRLASRYEPRQPEPVLAASDLEAQADDRATPASVQREHARGETHAAEVTPVRAPRSGTTVPRPSVAEPDGRLPLDDALRTIRPAPLDASNRPDTPQPMATPLASASGAPPAPRDSAHARSADEVVPAPPAPRAPAAQAGEAHAVFLPRPFEAPTDRRPGAPDDAPAPAETAGGPRPDIRISIGRIDVRATVSRAAAPPRLDRPERARPSLEDYLNERARGGRR